MSQQNHYKIVMLGNSGVGKTALVERVTDDIFVDAHVPTVGAQYVSLNLNINDQEITLEIWDTAGQEVFRSLVGFYARDAKGVFILFDVTDPQSFNDLTQWIEFSADQAPNAKIILFGNKTDLSDKREVTSDQISDFAEGRNLSFFEGSAKTGQGVRDAIESMADMVITLSKNDSTAVSLDKPSDNQQKKGCCK